MKISHKRETYMAKKVYPSMTFARGKLQNRIALTQTSKCIKESPIRPPIAIAKFSRTDKYPNPSDDGIK